MKLITTIFPADEIEVVLTIQSRVSRNAKDQPNNEPLITRYRSKIGNESLIFNPSVALILKSRVIRETITDALIPLNLIYRFTASVSAVYQKLQSEKLFLADGSSLYVDQKQALQHSRKISLFRNSLTITPGVASDRTGKLIKGITFNIEGNPIGTMHHGEVLGLLDVMDHLDISSFTLLAGVVDEIASMNLKMDTVLTKLDNIENLLKQFNSTGISVDKPVVSVAAPQIPMGGFNWQVADPGMFT